MSKVHDSVWCFGLKVARISKFIALMAVIGLALSGCTAEVTVEEGAVEQQEAFEAAERILGLEPDPERIETQVGDRTNTCIDALGDSGSGSRRGFDIDTVTISKAEDTFTYSFKAKSHVSTGSNIRGTISIYPLGQDEGGISLQTFIGGGTRLQVNAWTSATGDRFIQGASEVIWDGSELTTAIPLSYLEALGLTGSFKWSAHIVYLSNLHDTCPSGEFGSFIISDF